MNVPTFKSKLNSIMSDNMFDRTIGRKKTGKVNTKGLAKIAYSDKVFKKREERKGKIYNISLLLDCSGSMDDGERLPAMTSMLQQLVPIFDAMPSINLEINGFNTFIHEFHKFGNKKVDIDKLLKEVRDVTCNRTDKVTDYTNRRIYKVDGIKTNYDYEQFTSEEGKKGNSIRLSHGSGSNADGLMINYVAGNLQGKKGKNIIIVLSDGQPTLERHGPDSNSDYTLDTKVFGKRFEGKTYNDYELKKEVDGKGKEGSGGKKGINWVLVNFIVTSIATLINIIYK
jgi:hypothetical protein